MPKLLMAIFAALLFLSPVLGSYLSVTGDRVNLRSQASTQSSVLWTLGKYYPLKIVRQQGQWYQVEDFEKDRGWIHNSVVSASVPSVIVIRDNINVRQSNSTSSPVLFKTTRGVAYKVLTKRGEWVQVEHAEGHRGWIHRSLVWGNL
ncbi:SH3 domain-containing protein [Chrysiogenes arsenatis]|uniref:SH3 domain-containing protein n=1 Tax=Chrysiogenes arsenatis TaxID=309797 RepID=UPI0003F67C3F|nr:SH3 domain-containing protein [Chrysiogenes arsenatis]